MEEFATATATQALDAHSFWHAVPAAAYVLLGVVISGVFTVVATVLNIGASKKIKELENKNSRELKELENKHNTELKQLENAHNEKIQTQSENADKALRLLDDKLKAFSGFYNCYSEVLVSGTNVERHTRIENMRKSVYTLRLLAPSLESELDKLAHALNTYANFYFDLIHKKKTYTEEEEDKEDDKHRSAIWPFVKVLFEKLPSEM